MSLQPLLIKIVTAALVLWSGLPQNVTEEPLCLSAAGLSSLGFVPLPPAIDQNPVCQGLYNTSGACVNSNQTLTVLNSQNTFFSTQMENARAFYTLFSNATLFWQVSNGWVTYDPTQSLSQRISSLLTLAASVLSSFFGFANTSVTAYQNSCAKCLRAWAVLSKGVVCATTTRSLSGVRPVPSAAQNQVTVVLPANSTEVGTSLVDCIPLLDTYCSLMYGISVLNSSKPFNVTFDFSDGAISDNVCKTFQYLQNCTTAICNVTRNNYLTALFATNWVPFIPSAQSVQNLAAYLGSFSNATAFTPLPPTQNGPGIGLSSGAVGATVQLGLAGNLSGAEVFAPAWTALPKFPAALLGLVVVLVSWH